jgi:hypothetical protein
MLFFSFGSSVPSGKTERPRFRPELQDGSLVPMSRLQRGSGTWDPLFGASVTRGIRQLTIFGSLAPRTPLYDNREGLRTGAAWETNAGVARTLGSHRVSGYARLGWLNRAQDQFEGHARAGWGRQLAASCARCGGPDRQGHQRPSRSGVMTARADQPEGVAEIRYDPKKVTLEQIATTLSKKTGFAAETPKPMRK